MMSKEEKKEILKLLRDRIDHVLEEGRSEEYYAMVGEILRTELANVLKILEEGE